MILLLLACDPCAQGSPRLEVGLGLSDYLAVEDLDPALLVYGPQGGQHIDLAVQGSGLSARGTASAEMYGRIDGEIVAAGYPWFDLECRDGVLTGSGLRLFMEASPLEIVDRAMDIEVTVIDSRGRQAFADRTLLILDNPPEGM